MTVLLVLACAAPRPTPAPAPGAPAAPVPRPTPPPAGPRAADFVLILDQCGETYDCCLEGDTLDGDLLAYASLEAASPTVPFATGTAIEVTRFVWAIEAFGAPAEVRAEVDGDGCPPAPFAAPLLRRDDYAAWLWVDGDIQQVPPRCVTTGSPGPSQSWVEITDGDAMGFVPFRDLVAHLPPPPGEEDETSCRFGSRYPD